MALRGRLLWGGVVVAGVGAALLCGGGVAVADTGAKAHGGSPASSGSSNTTGTSVASTHGKSASSTPARPSALVGLPAPSSVTTLDSFAAILGKGSDCPPTVGAVQLRVVTAPSHPVSPVIVFVPTMKPRVAAGWNSTGFGGRSPIAAIVDRAAGVGGGAPQAVAAPTPAMVGPSPAPVPNVVATAPHRPNAVARVLAMQSLLGSSLRPKTAAALSNVHSAFDTAARATVAGLLADPAKSLIPAQTQVPGVVEGHSTLTIPCGTGIVVRADWYFATGPSPPNGLIWLQHGWLASSGDYDILAATLAQQTNSIVVVPNISSNSFACMGCWLGGDAMARGIANLFVGDRAALTASAGAAAGHPVTLPQEFVLAGHSAGGGLVVDAAGCMVDNGAVTDLAGIVLFDADPFGDMTPALAKLSGVNYRPVYQIAAHPYFWNTFGNGTYQLLQARPGQFDGVMLLHGSHVDSVQSSDPIIDLAAQLVAGISWPQNRQAVRTLAVGWINDMYAGHPEQGIYGPPGQRITIGDATAVVLPAPSTPITPVIDQLREIFDFIEGGAPTAATAA